MPPDYDGGKESAPSDNISGGTHPDGENNSIVSGLNPSLERRTFLKGSGALATTGGFATAHANADENGIVGDVPDEPEDGEVLHFDVHAIEVDIVYNRYGLHQPVGVMYALEEDVDEIREASGKVPCGNNVVFEDEDDDCFCDDVPEGQRGGEETRLIQPLSLRANQGDIIEIEFHNDLDRRASIHQTSLPYEVEESDGMDVGFNPDTTVAPGESITYRWFASHLGTHFFLDGANQAVDSADEPPQVANLTARGLFGAVNVLPKETTWTDPYTGEEDSQGRVQADIHLPEDLSKETIEHGFVPGISFRQFLTYYHTPEGIVTADGDQLTFPDSDEPQTVHAINYRADPTGNRIPELDDDRELREAFYSSWIHGDPGGGDNVYPMYVGDPVKTVAIGASIEENHVHHLHGHRWKENPPNQASDTVDSQTLGLGATYEQPFTTAFGAGEAAIDDLESVRPDMTFEEAFEVGAGGAHGTTGDVLFHCHLFPHYGEGMWGIMRILDKERDGLQPLPNNDPPIPKGSDIPGYPEFIPGEFGEAPPFPPYGAAGLDDFRNPTPEEDEALTRKGEILPGAPYTDPCDPDIEGVEPDTAIDGIKREYSAVILPANVAYNDDGHHDPNGLVYALEKYREVDPDTGDVLVEETVNDAELIREGKMNPEPFAIRANVGDCVEFTLRNEVTDENIAALPGDRLPEGDEDGLPESVPIEEGGKSNHIHFVSYDLLGSDSLANGFNYRQDVQPDEELTFRWFADEEGDIFFHDHITGIEDVMHGSFAMLSIEPPNSEWLDPYSGDPIRSGTQAIIQNPDGDDFREFCLFYQDFAQLVDRDGELVNNDAEHNENAGTMAVNYRNTPFHIRDNCDPAYVFSSFVHGDPSTPLLEAYEDDPVRIRLLAGAYEEQHALHVNGHHFEPAGTLPEESVSQIVGISEAFTLDVIHGEEGMNEKEEHGFFKDLVENPAGLPVKDHLYGSPIIDDLWEGMWGVHRMFGAEVDHLQPLPDKGAPDGEISTEELREMGHPAPFSDFDWTEFGQRARLLYCEDDDREFPPDKDARQNDSIDGNAPPQAPSPGDPCPDDAPVRTFDVSAVDAEIEYNDHGDHDPFGVVYTLDEHAEDVRKGRRPPTPLTLWANQGDCIEINFTNRIDPDEFEDHPHPEMRTEHPWERSERMSMHATHLEYDVLGSDGATVGFNWDQTVGPDETITYRWFMDSETPSSIFWDYADVRSTRHHGAYGNIVATPPETEVVDSTTAEPVAQGRTSQAMVKLPDAPDRRLFSLLFADAQFIVNEDDPDDCVVPPGPDIEDEDDPCNQLGDPEDQGYPGINYRSEPFIRRFEEDDDQWQVYSSEVHGDPATPIPRALLDDPVSFVVNKTADKARGLSFHLSDHQWNRFQGAEGSPTIGVDDRFAVGRSDELDILDGAGGLADSTGDFVYQELKQRRRLEGGFWGIFRVRNDLHDFRRPVQPLPDRSNGMPIDKRPGWVTARGDLTGDGTNDLIVVVPDSVRGTVDSSALYVFFGPVDERSITDLTGADVQIVGSLHDGEHDHGEAKVWLSDDLDVDSVDTLVGLLTNTSIAVQDCRSMADRLAGADGLENVFSALDIEEGETRSGEVTVRLAEGGDTGEVSLDAMSTDVNGDGSLELTLRIEDGPHIVVKGCESLLG